MPVCQEVFGRGASTTVVIEQDRIGPKVALGRSRKTIAVP